MARNMRATITSTRAACSARVSASRWCRPSTCASTRWCRSVPWHPERRSSFSLTSGIWLPPQRTFSSLDDCVLLVAEKTTHVEVGIERDVARGATVSVRGFHQHRRGCAGGGLRSAQGKAPQMEASCLARLPSVCATGASRSCASWCVKVASSGSAFELWTRFDTGHRAASPYTLILAAIR